MKKTLFTIVILLCVFNFSLADEKSSQSVNKSSKETMTKIVFRNITKGIDKTSYDAQPVTVYLYADKYTRVEEAPDIAGGLHGLIIMEGGQSWSVNLFTNTANYHHVDKEFYEMSTPLIPLAKRDMRYAGMVYGKEIGYFQEDAKESVTTIDGIEYSSLRKDKDGIQFELICKKTPITPYRLNVAAGEDIVYQYIFDEYKCDLPVDMSLFEVPSDVDIMPVYAQNTSDEIFQKKREKNLLSQTPNKKTLSKDKVWSLACSGMLWELMEGGCDSLAGREITEPRIKKIKKYLKEKWSINDREEIFRAIYWLMMEGYQIEFDEFGKRLAKFSSEDFDDMDDPVAKAHIRLVMKHHSLLPKGIAGWDYGAGICLSRWGYCCGYLTEREAWYFIKLIKKAVKADYKSWEDFGKSYYVGWNFWPNASKTISVDDFEKSYRHFLNSPESLWKKTPWNSNK